MLTTNIFSKGFLFRVVISRDCPGKELSPFFFQRVKPPFSKELSPFFFQGVEPLLFPRFQPLLSKSDSWDLWKRGYYAFAKSIDPCQPVQAAIGRNFLSFKNFLHLKRNTSHSGFRSVVMTKWFL